MDVDERIATTGLLSLDEIAEDVLNENNEENEDEAIEDIVPEVKPVTLKEAETCLENLRKYTQANTGTLILDKHDETFYLADPKIHNYLNAFDEFLSKERMSKMKQSSMDAFINH